MSTIKLSKTGYKYASANPASVEYEPSDAIKNANLPRKVDLRPYMTAVEDQQDVNSCSANAIAGAYEYLIKKHLDSDLDVSRLFIYFNARWRTNDQAKDEGSVIQYGIESLGAFGACVEKTWPYKTKMVTKKPSKDAYNEAAKFKTLDTQHVPVDLNAWRQCLAEGYPIVFGCVLFDSFDECNQHGGVVPMPNPKDVGRGEHGRHAMLCVGYSDVDKVFIVRNSWGAKWGDGGYCYMPYNYLMSTKLNGGDCWIIRSADQLPSPEDTWIDTKKTILRKKVDFDINTYEPDAYDKIKIVFYELDEDIEYTDETPDEYVELSDSIDFEYIEDDDAYTIDEDDDEDYEDDEEDEDGEDDEDYEDDEEDEDSEDDEDDEDYEEDEEDEDSEDDEDDEDYEEGEEDEDDEDYEDSDDDEDDEDYEDDEEGEEDEGEDYEGDDEGGCEDEGSGDDEEE